MARGAVSNTNHFALASAVVSAPPLSVSAWVYVTTVAFNSYALGITYTAGADTNVSGFYLVKMITTGLLRAYTNNNNSQVYSVSAAGVNLNAWNHIGGVWASTSSRIAYLNGVEATAETTTKAVASTPDKMSIGCIYRQDNSVLGGSGDYVAEIGYWNVALTTADMLMLSAGYSPPMVKPDGLQAYYPAIRGDSSGDMPDLFGAKTMVEVGTVSVQTHPRIFYPGLPWVVGKPGATAASGNPYYAFAQQQ